MKIIHILSNIDTFLTNEESKFLENYRTTKFDSLNEHHKLLVQNLIKRGVLNIDNITKIVSKNYK